MILRSMLALGLALAASLVAAAPITFGFVGSVTQLPTIDPSKPFAGTIDVGTRFSGSYTFDSLAPDGAAGPQEGSYASSGAPFGLTITFLPLDGPVTISADSVSIGVCDDCSGSDSYTVLAPIPPAGGLSIGLSLLEAAATTFASDALPTSPPDLTVFTLRDLLVTGVVLDGQGNEVQVDILGTLDALCIGGCVVPEPGMLLLLGAGLAALAARHRKAKPTHSPTHFREEQS